MEKKNFMPLLFSAAIFMACNNASNSSNDTASADSDTGNSMSNRSVTMDTGSNRMNTTANTTDTLSKMDRDFVMKAASGGMMEVEAANLAMQNASSERVKGFASMMIRDHSQANNELKTLASRRNVTLPTSPMPEEQKHLDMLRNKTGKAFDQAYMSMMVTDHQKDVGEFQKASKMCKDQECLGFASKTLPVLKTHLDSARAISKSKM